MKINDIEIYLPKITNKQEYENYYNELIDESRRIQYLWPDAYRLLETLLAYLNEKVLPTLEE